MILIKMMKSFFLSSLMLKTVRAGPRFELLNTDTVIVAVFK